LRITAGCSSLVLLAAGLVAAVMGPSSLTAARTRRIQYPDLPPVIQKSLAVNGVSEQRFPTFIAQVEAATDRRIAEGDREHLIYYALQSARFTNRPPIEPALSARAFVEALSTERRERLLADPTYLPEQGLPPAERTRIADLLTALRKETADARLAQFRQMPGTGESATVEQFYPDYVRVARFLYRKEFAAGGDAVSIATLYQTRAHSSDTQIDAGFGVSIGLGLVRALEPALRIRKVLVVGPGVDLAPRTDLIDASEPQSYQPLAVADALLSRSLAAAGDLVVHSVDVNLRVVRAVERIAREGLTWHVFAGIRETRDHAFDDDYRAYVRELGRAIGTPVSASSAVTSDSRYAHSIALSPATARAFSAERLNVITERLIDAASFDIVIVTNVLTYFDDRELALALSNIAGMMRPGGYLLHNESRDSLPGMASACGIPVIQMRTANLGRSKSQTLYDTVWLHRKSEK
jgi:methyltransferase family protein